MRLQELPWSAVERLSRDLPVIVPIAAVEQHGHHLPLETDSVLLEAIVARVEAVRDSSVVVAPLLWLGNSHHHLDFAGTLSCAPRVYLDLLSGLVDNLIGHGFRRLLLLIGHGGNEVPARQVLFEARQRYRARKDLLLLSATYWSLGSRPWESMPEIEQREMQHACEWETSMMLHLAPQRVGETRGISPTPPGGCFLPAVRAWITGDRTDAGHIGSPHLASAAKGEHLLKAFSRDVVELIDGMISWDGSTWR